MSAPERGPAEPQHRRSPVTPPTTRRRYVAPMVDRLRSLVARLPEQIRARLRGAVRGAPSLAETAVDLPAPTQSDDDRSSGPRPTDDFVTEDDIWFAYRLFAGREPDPDGLQFFRAHVGRLRTSEMLPYFAHSAEFRSGAVYRALIGGTGDDGFTVVTHRGHRLVVPNGDDAIGGVLRTHGEYEPHVIRALETLLEPGMVVVDGGANIGIVTMAAAELVGPSGRVLAIEALSSNAALVRLSAAVNGYEQVEVRHAALDLVDGLRVIDTAAGSNGIVAGDVRELLASGVEPETLAVREVVETVTLDALTESATQVDLLKLDIEGAEGLALGGAERLLERHRPHIVMEYSPDLLSQVSKRSGADVIEGLLRRGYTAEVLDEIEPSAAPGEPQEFAALMSASGRDHLDLLFRAPD